MLDVPEMLRASVFGCMDLGCTGFTCVSGFTDALGSGFGSGALRIDKCDLVLRDAKVQAGAEYEVS